MLRNLISLLNSYDFYLNLQTFIAHFECCFQHIFSASGGTQKGIAFKELLCGLVLLTRGKEEEKIKCQ